MKTSDLYLNQTAMVGDLKLRTSLSILIEDATPSQLQALGHMLGERSWSEEEIQQDMGSSAIEYLLDCLENADHARLMEVQRNLSAQGFGVL